MPDINEGLLTAIARGGLLAQPIIPPTAALGQGPPLVPPGFGTTLPNTAVSTRFPTAPGRVADPLTTPLMSGDLPAFLAGKTAEHNVGLLSSYPGMSFLKGMPTAEAAHAAAQRMSENMSYIFERSPKVMQEVSPQWYIGGNRIVNAIAERHGLAPQSMAAATAVMSPSTDWFQNVSMAERTADILFTKNRMPWSSQMSDTAKEIYTKPDQKALLKQIQGKTLDQLETPEQKAAWIRAYDQSHNPSAYREVAPDGGLGPFMVNKDGSKRKLVWQTNENIAKAVTALESGGDMNTISPLLGKMHKVRNFYNNLMHPSLAIGATADTHQVAAGLLSPFGSKDIPTKHAMPGTPLTPEQRLEAPAASSSDVTGFKGTYPIFEHATKLTAGNIGLLPHMAQSATWEPARTLFDVKTPAQKQIVRDVWTQVDKGLLTPPQARDTILRMSGGIKKPSWVSGGLLYDPRHASTY